MRTPRRCVVLLCAASALTASGCALTSKSDPIAPRYFSPERSGDVTSPRASARPPGPPAELRLGRIDGASHLQERLVFRDSDYELGYYAERRWTEAPEHYLKRRLTRVLFEERGLRHVVSGLATTLEVELTAFEEIRAPERVARIQVIVSLHDHRVVRWEETLTVDQPVVAKEGKGDVADAMVEALGQALRTVVDRIADHVVGELAAPPVEAPPAVAAPTFETSAARPPAR
jgi:cholesterol transport system auxiliary component